MMSTWCPSCCPNCFIFPPTSSSSWSPFALQNLLPVGTVTIKLTAEYQHLICGHTHAEDGWHYFQAHLIIPHLSGSEDITFCRELEFLAKQHFLSATYRGTYDGIMAVRIYLIPYDLGNVQGKLRIRKENVLGPAKRYLRNLLPKISQNVDKWDACKPRSEGSLFMQDAKDCRTLADIYSELSSPHADPIPGYGNISSRLLDFDDDLEGFGMRSTLYKYQRRSVAAMLQKELDLRDVPDPLFIPVMTMDKRQFYLQPGTMEVLQERPMTAPCRGGILCEELGTGKTVMMLSLIVATRTQISAPEPSIIDDRPIMTPLSFRHFPSSEFSTARKRLFNGKDRQGKSGSRVPSLVELLLHHNRVMPHCDIPNNTLNERYARSIEIEDGVHILPLGDMLHANVPFYHHYLGEPNNRERAQRNIRQRGPKVMYLTSATLIVVPANLLSQWDREITKHCDVPLRVLILRAKTPMPSVRSLATDYDIILMSYTRFAAESNMHDISKLHTWNSCACPEYPGFRVPNCTCQILDVSPFLQIRWKRLVIDEGHVSATLSTILVPFAKLLSVERRWIVTGTPTTNLLGLSLGSKVAQPASGQPDSDERCPEEEATVGNTDFDFDMDQSQSFCYNSQGSLPASPSATLSIEDPIQMSSKRVWNKYDREDLNKLGNMISHFIAVPQFSADSKLISTHVIEPLLDTSGPRRGAIQVLNQVMEMVMIRHKIEDVEKDVILPPVTQESVLLDLDPYAVKSFNALQANIAINAVDSQRTDQDYMFHSRNADHLQETVRNMSQILFWHVNDDLYNARQLLDNVETHFRNAFERNMPPEDISLLKESFRHIQLAMDDPLWRSIQTHEDIPYRVFDMVENVFDAWTRTPGLEPSSSPNQTGFLHADRLLKLYDMVVQKPLIREEGMMEWGRAVATRDRAFRKAYEESQHRKGKGRKRAKHTDDPSSSQMADNFAKKASATDTLKEMQKELDATMARLAREEDEDDLLSPSGSGSSQVKRPSNLVASSPLAKMRIGSSASTKLNYIINEVQTYSSTEKFLVFSESPLSLAHVAEALELIQVKFLRFTTQVTPQFREQLVLTFETSETYRVFLMELKHGARGLNLISASRVIFCEPVWQADVESQAIKRAHRIGQTKPITVKTLAIRETAEENMVERRTILRNSQEKLPKLIEEAGMRHYIANPKFITHPPTLTPTLNFPLIDLPPELTQPRLGKIMLRIPARPRPSPSLKRVRVEDPISESPKSSSSLCNEDGSPSKKKKGPSVRFQTP